MRLIVSIVAALATAAPAAAVAVPPGYLALRPTARPAPDSSVPPAVVLSTLEQQLVAAVDVVRADAGLVPLRIDDELELAARAHAQNLLAHGALTHDFVGAPGSMPFGGWVARYHRGGCIAENIASGTPTLAAGDVVQLWLRSPGHRGNLLSPTFTTIGVALEAQNGVWIAVAVFAGC